jgi:hypothetical protein
MWILKWAQDKVFLTHSIWVFFHTTMSKIMCDSVAGCRLRLNNAKIARSDGV